MRQANWLQMYAEYTSESESPDSFHMWTGLSVLASAVRRRVWLNQGIFLLYPNMYVILVGPPGRVAKSTSIRMGRKILLGVDDVFFGPDSVTREELIRQMAKVGEKHKTAALTIHSTELSSLIEPSGIAMIQFLTDIYDGDYKWRYSTKGSGRDVINDPLLNILAGTTPSWIAEGMPEDVIGHGFTARVIFVYEEQPRHLNPFPEESDPQLVHALTEDLKHIATLKGAFDWHPEARDLYINHYKKIAESIPSDYRIEGFHWRKKIHLLKIAMLLSLSERDSMVIHAQDIETAWTMISGLEERMYKTFSAVGKYEHAMDMERILTQLEETGGMTLKDIYTRNRASGDINAIGNMIAMLRQMGKIKKLHKDGEEYLIPTSLAP